MIMSADTDNGGADPIVGGGYLGSKLASGAYQTIIAAMPPYDTYIEPFVGSGAIINNKPPAEYSNS